MSTYILKSTGQYPFHRGDIRLLYPDMETFVLPEEYAEIEFDNWPEAGENHKVIFLPLEISNGRYFQKFEVVPYTEEDFIFYEKHNKEEKEKRALHLKQFEMQEDLDKKQGSTPDVIG